MKIFFTHIFFLACSFMWAQETASLVSAIEQSKQICQKTFEEAKFPGLSVAVLHDNTIIWAEGFGYADIENQVPSDPMRSLYRIGSISKALTAVGLARLYEDGKVDLDAEVQRYVPYFPEKKWPITVRQVAQHVAGIRHYRGEEFLINKRYNNVREGIGIFAQDTLMFRPGSKYMYSSYGWNLVSAVMEGACNCNFLDYMQKEVFTKGGLFHTFPDRNEVEMDQRVAFYVLENEKNILAPEVDNSYKWAGGGFISTAYDVATFGYGVMHERFNTAKTNETFWTPYTLEDGKKTNYGLGWAVGDDKKGRSWVGHAGGSVGGSSMLLMYPQYDLVVVTLINQSNAQMGDLAFRIANQFIAQIEH